MRAIQTRQRRWRPRPTARPGPSGRDPRAAGTGRRRCPGSRPRSGSNSGEIRTGGLHRQVEDEQGLDLRGLIEHQRHGSEKRAELTAERLGAGGLRSGLSPVYGVAAGGATGCRAPERPSPAPQRSHLTQRRSIARRDVRDSRDRAPISVETFQERAHLRPSAPAPAPPRRPARRRGGTRLGGPSPCISRMPDVMQISARSRPSRPRSAVVGDVDARARPRGDAPMRFCARSISSAPVTTRRTRRISAHRSASASSRHAAGRVREGLEMHRAVACSG